MAEEGIFNGGKGKSVTISIRRFEMTALIITSVGDPDPDPLVRGTDPNLDPDSDPSLFS